MSPMVLTNTQVLALYGTMLCAAIILVALGSAGICAAWRALRR